MASAGRRTSSRVMSHWIDARIDSFGSIAAVLKPSVDVATRKPRMVPSSVFAQMTATSAMVARPIQRLAPLITQVSPSLRATAFMPAGSLPASGSVRPKQPIRSPWAMPGSHCCFWVLDLNA
jgi:hypothetical protein